MLIKKSLASKLMWIISYSVHIFSYQYFYCPSNVEKYMHKITKGCLRNVIYIYSKQGLCWRTWYIETNRKRKNFVFNLVQSRTVYFLRFSERKIAVLLTINKCESFWNYERCRQKAIITNSIGEVNKEHPTPLPKRNRSTVEQQSLKLQKHGKNALGRFKAEKKNCFCEKRNMVINKIVIAFLRVHAF